MRKIRYIVIHHSATKDDGSTPDIAAIRRWHKEHNKWADIGYHFLVERIGNAMEIEVLVGRPIDMNGAHAPGRNTDSIGICFVGNFDLETPSSELLNIAAARVVVPMMHQFDIPIANVLRHSDVNRTNCPGQKFPFGYFMDVIASIL